MIEPRARGLNPPKGLGSLPADLDEQDIEWLGHVADGDRGSFQQLLARYKNLLCATVFKVLNDAGETEDVFQEVSSRIWVCARQYQADKGRVITWLVSMARNCAIDRLRAQQRRHRWVRDYREDRSLMPDKVDQSHGYEVADRRERCRAVREEVNKLSKEQREAIELAYFQDMTQNEIAQHLGHPVGTIKARIRRGMLKLREPMLAFC